MPDLFTGPDFISAVSATLLIRVGAVLAMAWLLTRLLRQSAASTRHAIWSAALASLLVLPAGAVLLPRWNIPGTGGPLPVSALPPALHRAATMPMTTRVSAPAEPHAIHGPVLPPVTENERGASPFVIALITLWAAGALIGLLRMALCVGAVSRLQRSAEEVPEHIDAAARAAARELGITRRFDVRWTDALTVPVNWGLSRPVIMLPASASEWSAQRMRVVLLHELAHVRRGDYPMLLLTRVAQALYWVNPLVWVAVRESEMELERACDDEVLRAGTASTDYAEHLHAIAVRLAGARQPAGALAMARPSTLRERVAAILARTTNRQPLSRRAAAGAAAVMALVALPLAGVRLLGEGRAAAQERGALISLNLEDPEWRSRGAFLLGSRRASDGTAPLAALLAGDSMPAVRGMAAWALGEIGGRGAFDALALALRDHDPHVREMAVMALGRTRDPRGVDLLEPMLRDSFAGVRSVMTTALSGIGTPEAGELLARLVTHDADQHTRMMAGYSTRMVLGTASFATLSALLRDTSAAIRRMAIANLGELGDGRAIAPLTEVVQQDSSAMVRGAAAWALGTIGTNAAVPGLAAAMDDEDWQVRMAAAAGLGKTGGPRAADLLMKATRDPEHQVRLTAVEALEARAH